MCTTPHHGKATCAPHHTTPRKSHMCTTSLQAMHHTSYKPCTTHHYKPCTTHHYKPCITHHYTPCITHHYTHYYTHASHITTCMHCTSLHACITHYYKQASIPAPARQRAKLRVRVCACALTAVKCTYTSAYTSLLYTVGGQRVQLVGPSPASASSTAS